MTNSNTSKLSYVFHLEKHDHELDFLDLDLSSDLNLYVDPILLYRSPIKEFNEAHSLIVEFFRRAIDFVKTDKRQKAELMCRFPDAENLLGIAETKPGHGPRNKLGYKIYEELVNNTEIQEKGLVFLNEFQLLIDGISFDLVSDAAVQISKQVFINYTQEQCRIHNIELHPITIEHYFYLEEDEWDSKTNVLLPVNPLKNNAPFLLTPHTVVRRYPEANYFEFYNEIYRYVLLAREKGAVWSGLGKKPKVHFKDIEEKYRIDKAEIVKYVKENPEEKEKFFKIIRPVEESSWLEQLSLQWGINVNQVISPEILLSLNETFSSKIKKYVPLNIYAAIAHQTKLIQPRKRIIHELVDLTKICKEKLVLLLGNYNDPNGIKRLNEIETILSKRYQVVLLNMIKKPLPEPLEQSVIRLSTLARFTVIEDTYPGGQLFEIGTIKTIGVIATILRERGKQSSYMSVGISMANSNLKEIPYDLISGNGIDEKFVEEAAIWAETRYGENKEFWKQQYPWS